MPVLDFGDWPHVITAMPGYRILATMCYPRKHDRREELYATCVAEYILSAVDDPAAWSRPPEVGGLLPLFKARHYGRSHKEVMRTTKLTNHQGHIAGDVLGLIRWVTAHGYQGSVLKVCHVMAELAKIAKATGKMAVTLGMTQITYPNDHALLGKAWSPYKDVAHFWAAHNLMINRNAQEDAEGTIFPPVVRWFDDTDAFVEFLAIAEDFRKFGEDYIPAPADKPTLNPRTTWRVPDHVQLPALDPYDPPLLPQEIRDALASYRA